MSRRILHVVGGMERGGIQSWLMHLLRTVDRQRYHMDFLVHSSQPCTYDREILQLGSRLLPCSHPRLPWQFAGDFARALTTQIRYDVVHSHVYAFSGYVLQLAARHRVPLRIAHGHTDRRVVEAKRGLVRQGKLRLMKSWIRRYAVVKVAASGDAAADLFGRDWNLDPTVRVVHCGLELAPFKTAPDRAEMRARLGLPANALIIGHVGRFTPEKKQAFLVEITAEAVKRGARAHLLLVGDGPLRREVEQRAAALGIRRHVLFAGDRDDVPAIMGAAIDAFVFPSLHEGLGLVVVEAQAAGLPCLVSDRVPREADVVPGLIRRLPLEQGPAAWARHVLEISAGPQVSRTAALAAVESSPFNITRSVEAMTRIYDGDV